MLLNKMKISRFDVATQNADSSNSHRKVGRSSQNGVGNTKVAPPRKKRLKSTINAKSEFSEGKVSIDLPLQTKSEANCFESWRIKHARHKAQQRLVALMLNPLRDKIKLPCKIMLTRFAPKTLDEFENLPMSFKYIVDAVCAIITGEYRAGKADSDKRISIACQQVKSKEYGVRILLEF